MSVWAEIVRDLMREQRTSQRGLCAKAHVCRQTFRRFLNGETMPSISFVEAILLALGYELDALPLKGPAVCQSAPQACVPAVASSDQGSDAATCSNTIASEKPGSMKPAPQRGNAATTRNGSAKAKPTSQQIRIVAAAARLRPSSTTSLHTVATSACFGHGQTGNPYASPVTPDLSSAKSVAHRNRMIIGRIAASFQVAA